MTQDNALETLKTGVNVFLTGEPGAGKTHTINRFVEWLYMQGKGYALTASTGIAATHIGGTTIHSWSGLGIKRVLTDYHYAKLDSDEYVVRRVNSAQVLIIDEISMLDATVIDNLDLILKHLRGNTQPFGGLQMIFVGDFFQLPPVVKEGEMKFAFESEAWKVADPRVCYLTEQHRQNDPVFLEILSAMRAGTITPEHKKTLELSVKEPEEQPETCLFTHNFDVDRVNDKELSRIEGEEKTYEMHETGIPFLVGKLKENCLAPATLRLKIGATVMFVRNNFEEGYVNGTIGHVVAWDNYGYPVVETKDGKRIVPERAEWAFEEYGQKKATIQQIPLRLAWAITVHKSQGMSLDSASVDLSRAFECGQGYVAISRVRSLAGLHLEGMNDKTFEMHPKVIAQDKVFRETGI